MEEQLICKVYTQSNLLVYSAVTRNGLTAMILDMIFGDEEDIAYLLIIY